MKGHERRAQVLEIATRLFADKGYHSTTVEDIVTEAGIARGTFYVYFNDKRSIFDELLDNFIDEIDDQIIRIDPALGLEECLRLMRKNIRVVLEIALEHPNRTRILVSEAVGLDAEFDRKLLDFYSRVTQLLESSLTDGQTMGVVRECNVTVNAIFVLGALKELLYQVTMRERDIDIDEVVEEFLALFRDGFLTLPDG